VRYAKAFTHRRRSETIDDVEQEFIRVAARDDLLTSETLATSARHRVTNRAEIFMASRALTLDDVLATLNISRATWYRRLEALRDWESQPPTPKGQQDL
jgi:hypothetical protein